MKNLQKPLVALLIVFFSVVGLLFFARDRDVETTPGLIESAATQSREETAPSKPLNVRLVREAAPIGPETSLEEAYSSISASVVKADMELSYYVAAMERLDALGEAGLSDEETSRLANAWQLLALSSSRGGGAPDWQLHCLESAQGLNPDSPGVALDLARLKESIRISDARRAAMGAPSSSSMPRRNDNASLPSIVTLSSLERR